jgi:hypothetical protein
MLGRRQVLRARHAGAVELPAVGAAFREIASSRMGPVR